MSESAPSLDPSAIAREAGLSEEQATAFVAGCTEDTAENMILDRESYTRLQAAFEASLAAFLENTDYVRGQVFVIINTEKPSTHSWLESHPIFATIRRLVRKDSMILICRYDGLAALEDDNRFTEKERAHLNSYISMLNKQDPRMSVSQEGRASHMVFDGTALGLPALAFLAEQMPSTHDGEVVFGKVARELAEKDLAEHKANVKAGRTHDTVRQYLGLDHFDKPSS